MPRDFYLLTLFEIRCLVARHLFSSAKEWEHTRFISYTMYAVNTSDDNKPELSDYMPLLIDNFTEKEVTRISNEDMQALLERDKQIREVAQKQKFQ